MAPPHAASPYPSSPPSPVTFVPPRTPATCTSPTWDEYLANNSNGSFEFVGCSFPVNMMNFSDPNMAAPRETRQGAPVPTKLPYPSMSGYPSTSTSSGPSRSYSAPPGYPPPPPRRLSPAPVKMAPPSQKCTVSSLPSPALFQRMSATTIPPVMTFPLSVMRPDGIKTLVRPEMKVAKMKVPLTPDTPSRTQVGRWTKREHELFLEGLQRFGRSWKKISSLVHTRTLVQIRTHAQKYLQKQSRAAVKADAKAAEAAASHESKSRPKSLQQQQLQQGQRLQQPRVAASGQCTLQLDAPRSSALIPRQWKSAQPRDRNSGFAPLTFPSSLSASASTSRDLSATSSCTQMTASPRSAFQPNSASKLDQLLQDDTSTIPAFIDEYYTSPTAIEDDLLRPLYTGEHWVSRLAHPGASANYSNKRRRLDTISSACSAISTSPSVAVPALRPAFPNAAFKPLPAPENLSSPSNSPSAYAHRQSAAAAVLLAAHETDETTNYTNAWL